MPKVKVFLDAGCSNQILLDDGRCIIEIKERCSFAGMPRDFRKKRDQIARETKKQIFLSGELFGSVKEGSELKIRGRPDPDLTRPGPSPSTGPVEPFGKR